MSTPRPVDSPPPGRKAPSHLWGEVTLAPGEPFPLQVGPIRACLLAVDSEVRVATEPRTGESRAALDEASLRAIPEAPDDPGDPDWQRFSFRSAPGGVKVLPALPDRPVILSTGGQLHLRPRAQVRIYVDVPVWISVRPLEPVVMEGAAPDVLVEIPTVTLSSTWFGDFMEGEMGYWLPCNLLREGEVGELPPHLVACPVQIFNSSTEVLKVDKLCLRLQHATVFEQDGSLWADEMRISYLGGGAFSRLHWSGRPPIEAMNATRLTPPRELALQGIKAWTFAHLRDLPGWRA